MQSVVKLIDQFGFAVFVGIQSLVTHFRDESCGNGKACWLTSAVETINLVFLERSEVISDLDQRWEHDFGMGNEVVLFDDTSFTQIEDFIPLEDFTLENEGDDDEQNDNAGNDHTQNYSQDVAVGFRILERCLRVFSFIACVGILVLVIVGIVRIVCSVIVWRLVVGID